MNSGGADVLSKCANPRCKARMKYMHDGSLYVVPKPAMDKYWTSNRGEFSAPPGKQIECFWLCDMCSRQLTISKSGELECKAVFVSHRRSEMMHAPLISWPIGDVHHSELSELAV